MAAVKKPVALKLCCPRVVGRFSELLSWPSELRPSGCLGQPSEDPWRTLVGSVLQSYSRQRETASSFHSTGVGLCLGVSHLHSVSLFSKLNRQEEACQPFPQGQQRFARSLELVPYGNELWRNGMLTEWIGLSSRNYTTWPMDSKQTSGAGSVSQV